MPVRYVDLEVENYSKEIYQIDFHVHKGPYLIKHCHAWWEIMVVLDHPCINIINEKSCLLNKNQIQLIRPNDLHEIRNYDNIDSTHINVEIRKNMFKGMAEYFDKDLYHRCLEAQSLQPITVTEQTIAGLMQLVFEAQSVYFSNIPERQKFTKQFGMSLLLAILRNEKALFMDSAEQKSLVSQAVNLMKKEENIALSISDICEILGVSERHISRVFKQWYNKRPIEVFRDIKLDYACGLLCTTGLSVPSIIEKIGFWNVGHFNRIFKDKFGTTPGVYKKTVCIREKYD